MKLNWVWLFCATRSRANYCEDRRRPATTVFPFGVAILPSYFNDGQNQRFQEE
jgi:hypothetical protein